MIYNEFPYDIFIHVCTVFLPYLPYYLCLSPTLPDPLPNYPPFYFCVFLLLVLVLVTQWASLCEKSN